MNEIFYFNNYPLPPTINKAYPTNKAGRRFKSNALKVFLGMTQVWSLRNFKEIDRAVEYFNTKINDDYWIEVSMFVHMYKHELFTKKNKLKKIDVSNRIKSTHDSLAAILEIDDNHFSVGKVEFIISNKNSIDIVLKASKIKTKDDLKNEIQSHKTNILYDKI